MRPIYLVPEVTLLMRFSRNIDLYKPDVMQHLQATTITMLINEINYCFFLNFVIIE